MKSTQLAETFQVSTAETQRPEKFRSRGWEAPGAHLVGIDRV
jgi:hypothetical protein